MCENRLRLLRSGMTPSGVPRLWNPLTEFSRARISSARSSTRDSPHSARTRLKNDL